MNFYEAHIAKYEKNTIQPNLPENFSDFWATAVAQCEAKPIHYTRKVIETPYSLMKLYEIRYNTIDETEVVAWFQVPHNAQGKLPCVVHFHGGGMSKSMLWPIVGSEMCAFSIDVRGQNGDTIDRGVYHSGGDFSHCLESGILDKNEYYLRNVYLDAYRAVEVVARLEEVDPEKIGVYGGSQGGGMALATANLNKRVKAAAVICPSYTCMHSRLENRSGVIGRISEYILRHPEATDLIYQNLLYFDGLNHATGICVPTLIGLTMDDKICLPHFTYSAYQALTCQKEIHYYPFSPHAIPSYHWQNVIRFFKKQFA